MKSKLAIVTGNPLKFRELSAKLSEYFDCEQKILENYFEIQGTPEEILRHKLSTAYEIFQEPVLVDDTSLHFAELGGFPGPYIKDFIRAIPIYDMGMKFAGGRIKVACRLGVYDGVREPVIGVGEIEGDIVTPKQVDAGDREFDVFIQIDGTDKPMIEMSTEEKNLYSHRGRALDALLEQLSS
jgi:non-canonical purine NTP pyrophosphatase (RdgB/HAM1 family)